ncbi:TetR/AcrR family transcriptional regulator [Bernardetia sp.]|uniref:TetR/AcrR family transcriptional regulator n=1 Tax=Bernardetia sp. TaxID=1937974 RepID=UPI0025BCC3D5|nr:TetR/AcrR family transcriptional regulator [Bernardetia sp.]
MSNIVIASQSYSLDYLDNKLATLDTREKIIYLGEALFQQFGYNGFSYKHIAQKLGIKNAAIHYHFPSKEDLGIAIIEHARGKLQRWKTKTDELPISATEKLEKYIDGMYGWQIDKGNRVCLMAASGTDFFSIPPTMQEKAQSLGYFIRNMYSEILKEGRENNEFYFEGEPKHQALNILFALQGSLLSARLHGKEVYQIAKNQVFLNLKAKK